VQHELYVLVQFEHINKYGFST